MLVDKWRSTILVACSALMILTLGAPAPAAGIEPFHFKRAFGPDGTTGTEFMTAGSVAVDEGEGSVYVLDRAASALYKFDLDGNPVDFGGASPNLSGNELSGLAVGGGPGVRQVAVDQETHTIYLTGHEEAGDAKALLAFKANGEPSIFPATGTNELTGFAGLRGVAVDSNGSIYLSGTEPNIFPSNIRIYSRSGSLLVSSVSLGLIAAGNVAVAKDGDIYVLQNLVELTRYIPSEYPVTNTTKYTPAERVDPNAAVSVAVDPLTNNVYANEQTQVRVFAEDGKLLRTFAAGELENADGIAVANAKLEGIAEKVARPFVADNPSGGPNQVKIFEEELCICAPAIEGASATAVSGDAATLRAKINPNNRATSYWFEYGVQDCESGPCFKIPINGAPIGDGRRGILVAQAISGLTERTTYHFRVVAVNVEGITKGVDKTFTTQNSGLGFALGDARVWEMVSPANKFNGQVVPFHASIVQAAQDGNGLAYASVASIVGEPHSNHPPQPATALANRGANGVWGVRDLSAPHTEAALISSEFKSFSPNLLRAAMEPSDSTPLSPEASEMTSYLWEDGSPPRFTPLVNPSNVPSGTEFGPEPGVPDPVRVEGVSPDLEHIVIRSNTPLVEGAETLGLYMWSDGELEAISKLPESEGGGFVRGMLGSGRGSIRHAISTDGSRVFWTPSKVYAEVGIDLDALYMRDTAAGESVRLDVVQPGATGAGEANPAFNIASADGRVVFFTDSQQLTEGASPEGRDLYRCEIGQVGEGLGCVELTDLSAPLAGSGESAEVFDLVPAAADDGTRLYFAAKGALDETPNVDGETASAGQPNLYYWQEGMGTRFIGTLSPRDSVVWGQEENLNPQGYGVNISAASSPNGRFFVFTSERGLAGSENHNGSDEPTSQVFLYDAETTEITCVSCDPTGAAPVGEQLPGGLYFPPDPVGLWTKRWAAATLPEASENESSGRSFYHPRTVLDNGRVFFNSVDPLVPADSNGNWDVYQYQPIGVGSCTVGTDSAAVVRSAEGCVGLISSGVSEGDAGFLDTTPSGNDVFFLTRGRLSVLDRDDEVDAYDARVNGTKQVLNPIKECVGEACQAAGGPPNDPTPASEAFRGPEATLRCRKGQHKVHRKGRTVCVKKKHKKKGHHQKKKAGKNGRAGR